MMPSEGEVGTAVMDEEVERVNAQAAQWAQAKAADEEDKRAAEWRQAVERLQVQQTVSERWPVAALAQVSELTGEIKRLEEIIKRLEEILTDRDSLIRELEKRIGRADSDKTLARKRRAALHKLDEELFEGGPIQGIEEVNEEALAWLLELAQRNDPVQGVEVNEREVAQIIKSITPLVGEVERLQDILVASMVVYPCHALNHRGMHENGEVCADQLSMMGILLAREVNLPPSMMRQAKHREGSCSICDRGEEEESLPPSPWRADDDEVDEARWPQEDDDLPW